MLCGIHSPSSHHNHRFLRSFRSHKNLRSSNKTASLSSSSQDDMMYHYPRRPSDASSFDSTGSRRPSTSSRSDASIDWDPLRLHPPSLAPGPAPPPRETLGEERIPRPRYQPHELRHARSSHALRQALQQSSSNTVIYGGFDFGFNNKPITPTPATTTTNTTTTKSSRRMTRSPSPTPSDASSECSISIGGSDMDDDALMMGLAPAPAPRPRPRPRPQPHHTGPSGLPLDGDAEYFMRRGGWKRRGIVFVNTMPLAGEEETFEI